LPIRIFDKKKSHCEEKMSNFSKKFKKIDLYNAARTALKKL